MPDRLIKQSPELKDVWDATRNREVLSPVEMLSLEKGEVIGRALINGSGALVRSISIARSVLPVGFSLSKT